mmetsp:Transcript_606/g.1722  ORF Transcript_606/g.1722 Transcript_606/m.1722 type:complete len:253 (+) Transcript_606:62-820(+)
MLYTVTLVTLSFIQRKGDAGGGADRNRNEEEDEGLLACGGNGGSGADEEEARFAEGADGARAGVLAEAAVVFGEVVEGDEVGAVLAEAGGPAVLGGAGVVEALVEVALAPAGAEDVVAVEGAGGGGRRARGPEDEALPAGVLGAPALGVALAEAVAREEVGGGEVGHAGEAAVEALGGGLLDARVRGDAGHALADVGHGVVAEREAREAGGDVGEAGRDDDLVGVAGLEAAAVVDAAALARGRLEDGGVQSR